MAHQRFRIDCIKQAITDVFETVVATMIANITPKPDLSPNASFATSTAHFSTTTEISETPQPSPRPISKNKKIRRVHIKHVSSRGIVKHRRQTFRSSHNGPNFRKYILAVQQYTHPSLTIGRKTVDILNNFLGDVLERMTVDAKRLSRNRVRRTLGESDVRTAIRLMLPEGMNRDGQTFAARCVADYRNTVLNRMRAQLRKKANRK